MPNSLETSVLESHLTVSVQELRCKVSCIRAIVLINPRTKVLHPLPHDEKKGIVRRSPPINIIQIQVPAKKEEDMYRNAGS